MLTWISMLTAAEYTVSMLTAIYFLIAVKHHVNYMVQLTWFSCLLPQYWSRVYAN